MGSDTLAGEGVADGSSLMIEQSPSLAASETIVVCSDTTAVGEGSADGSSSIIEQRQSEAALETWEMCPVTMPTSPLHAETASVNFVKTRADNGTFVRPTTCEIPTSTESVRTLPDIGNLKREKLTEEEKMGILKRGEIPLRLNLPKRDCGDKKRKFNPDFLSTYKWLRYSKMLDDCLCVVCFLFSS